MKYLIFIFLFSTIISLANAQTSYNLVCKDDNDFTTIFKINEISFEIVFLGSMISDKAKTSNKGEKNVFNKKVQVHEWNNKFAITSGINSQNQIYLRFFDFINLKVTVSIPYPNKKPWIKKSHCIKF